MKNSKFIKEVFLLVAFILICFENILSQTYSFTAYFDSLKRIHPNVSIWEYKKEAAIRAISFSKEFTFPLISVESPTGEFFATGITWSFQFPGVYAHKRNMAIIELEMVNNNNKLEELEWRKLIAQRFYQVQYDVAKNETLSIIDSVYKKVLELEEIRRKEGVENIINYQLAVMEYGFIHREKLLIESQAKAGKIWLATLLGKEVIEIEKPTSEKETIQIRSQIISHPLIFSGILAKKQKWEESALNALKLAPSFYMGYLNQGPLETPTYYRLNAGIYLPLFWSQQNAKVKYLKLQSQVSEQESKRAQWDANAEYKKLLEEKKGWELLEEQIQKQSSDAGKDYLFQLYQFYQSGTISGLDYYKQSEQYYRTELQRLEIWINLKNIEAQIQYFNYE